MFPAASLCIAVLVSAVSCHPSYLIPQSRSEAASISIVEQDPSNTLQYQVVPSSEYAIATVQSSDSSIMDYVLSPVTTVISLGSTALSAASWVIINGSLVFLGMAIVIGFCALTPYCTLTIEKPSFFGRENTSNFPYLENLEYYFHEAYNRYQDMQNNS